MASVDFFSKEGVVSGYQLHGYPFFSVWQGKELKFQNQDENEIEALQKLSEGLDFIINSNSTALFTLKVYDSPKINSSSPIVGSFNFRLSNNEFVPAMPSVAGVGRGRDGEIKVVMPESSVDSQRLDRLEQMMQQLLVRQIDEEIKEIEEDEDEDEELTEAQLGEIQSARAERIVNNLRVVVETAQPLIGTVMEMFKNWNGVKNASVSGPVHDGRDVNQKIMQSIDELATKLGPEVLANALVKLAAMSPEKLKGVLQWL